MVAVALHDLDEVRDQVVPALEFDVDQRPRLPDPRAKADEAVVGHDDPAEEPDRQRPGPGERDVHGVGGDRLVAGGPPACGRGSGENDGQDPQTPSPPGIAVRYGLLAPGRDEEHLRGGVGGDLGGDDVLPLPRAAGGEEGGVEGDRLFREPADVIGTADGPGRTLSIIEGVAAAAGPVEHLLRLDVGAFREDTQGAGVVAQEKRR